MTGIETPANVATPPTAATVVVPPSVVLPGLAPSASVTLPVKPVTRLPNPSTAFTCIDGAIATPAVAVDGCCWNTSCVALPAEAAVPVIVMVTPIWSAKY